jgi:hypothetical protein
VQQQVKHKARAAEDVVKAQTDTGFQYGAKSNHPASSLTAPCQQIVQLLWVLYLPSCCCSPLVAVLMLVADRRR